MVKRNTKQKAGIKAFLMTRIDHPTADIVYNEMKKTMPNISLGTVYRNLNTMAKDGEILRLKFDDGQDHYDARLEPHHHFICRDCGNVVDIFGVEEEPAAPKSFEGEIFGAFTYFYGRCPSCMDTNA